MDDLFSKVITNGSEEKRIFDAFVDLMGEDKCLEYAFNYSKITKKEVFGLQEFYEYINYEYDLASILFVILRIQEDLVKGFLANCFKRKMIDIEKRDSRYSKVKYYLKFPDLKHGGYLDIRTFNYEKGPVCYYDAIKYLDFGDINLIMSHLTDDYLEAFSNNKNIINDLDATRKIRNFVYHHNTLFSYGKKALKQAIIIILRNYLLIINK